MIAKIAKIATAIASSQIPFTGLIVADMPEVLPLAMYGDPYRGVVDA